MSNSKTYALGAFGTLNIGDDAILEGMHQSELNLVPIAHTSFCRHDPLNISSVLSAQIFKPEDTLILGGGGLFYSMEAIKHWLLIARNAVDAGANFEIRAVGFESYEDDWRSEAIELFGLASKITFRSKTSIDLFGEYFDFEASYEKDYATNLKPQYVPPLKKVFQKKKVGIVTTGSLGDDYEDLITLINKNRQIDFFHMPHSRSPLGWENNDFVVGEYIFTNINKVFHQEPVNFYCSTGELDLQKALDMYSEMDAVISYRFHGVIFADFFDLPCAVMRRHALKQISSLEYNPRASLISNSYSVQNFLDEVFR